MSIVEKAVDKHRRARRGESDEKTVFDLNSLTPEAAHAEGEPREHPAIDLRFDYEKLARQGLIPYGNAAPTIADEIRRIKRLILARAFPKDGTDPAERTNMLMVSSAMPGEGKTYVSVNLAMSVALERDRTAVLVDADVAKPHISRELGIGNQTGLMDLLLDSSIDVGEVMLQSDMPALKVIPAGQHHRHATELLASDRMEQIVAELAGRYPDRLIIVDSPPLLPTAEAPVLAGLMGQILMVIHAGETPQQAVLAALDCMPHDARISLILNKSRLRGGSDYYSSYYGQD